MLGLRRADPIAYKRKWRDENREQINAYSRDYYHNVTKADPAKLAAKNKSVSYSRRKKKYGVSKDQYLSLLEQQKGKCYICREFHGEALRIDHNHSTGEVRKLLCNNCNAGLGFFLEDRERLKSAIRYLNLYGS